MSLTNEGDIFFKAYTYFSRVSTHVPSEVQNTSQMMRTQTSSEAEELHQNEENQPQISSSTTNFLASPLQRLSDLARGQSESIHAQTASGN